MVGSNSSKDENPAPATNAGSSSSAANKASTTAQFNADAQLLAQFEKSGKLFNYAKSVPHAPQALSSDEKIVAYLSKIQRGSLVQSVGCTLAVEPRAFKIVAHSQNCFDMLGVSNLPGPGLMGSDPRNLFTPSSNTALSVAFAASRGLSYLNPIWVHTITNHRSFFAILHTIDVGILIDLEPAHSGDRSAPHAAAKIGVTAASRLQSLPSGDIGVLCDALVEEVQKLSGFDRVMVYKFHEDEHGEVLAEIRRADLEPYLGLHYPATDIPQAARFLFKQSRVRMICDSTSKPVKIVQSPEISQQQPLCLASSTLRAPHACHVQYMTNMGSIASLVLAILVNVNGDDSTKLWGLVVCHHTGPRHVSAPLRFACELLVQVFSLQLQVELQLAVQLALNRILRNRLLLCGTLLRRGPITASLMDFVKCDGAALHLDGKSSCVGVAPDESRVKDLSEWLVRTHGDRTGLITECLADAGYPGADALGDSVCGMAAERIDSSGSFLFWFRSHAANEIKWLHNRPKAEDEGSSSSSLMKMHPRTSAATFLEVVKGRSFPWEAADIDSARSLRGLMEDWLREGKRDELASVAVDLSRMIESAASPVFGVDSSGLINGWNTKMCELTGVGASEAHGKSLVNEFVHRDSRGVVETLITKALQFSKEEENVEVKFVKNVCLRINTCASKDCENGVVGVCFVGQDITAEKAVMDKFVRLEGDYKSIVESVNPLIPPIFASDENGRCSEWNAVMENLTGYTRQETIGKLLADEVFGSLCKLKGEDVFVKFTILLHKAIQGYDPAGKLRFGFYDRRGELVEMHLTANKKMDKSGHVVGCLCFLQTILVSDKKEDGFLNENTELEYLRQEVKKPLCGIRLTHQQLREGSSVSDDDQKQLLETSGSCEKQILSIIEASEMELKEEEFLLGSVINAIVSQAMISLKEKNLRLVHDTPEKIKNMRLCGDEIKLQSALSGFLDCVADYAPSPDGWVEVKASHGLKLVKDGIEFVHLQFRMVHLGQGVPQDIIEEMFGRKSCGTRRGVGLNISQKIVSAMNGNVCYVRDENEISYFRVDIELKTGGKKDTNNNVLLVES